MSTKISAIIAASGNSSRMGDSCKNKLLYKILGKPVIIYVCEAFEACFDVSEIIIGASQKDISVIKTLCDLYNIAKLKVVTLGGNSRMETVQLCYQYVADEAELVAVTDAARPFVTPKLIKEVSNAAMVFGAAIPTVPATDTIKVVKDGVVIDTPERCTLFNAQTPQIFTHSNFRKMMEYVTLNRCEITDDASIAEKLGITVKIVEGLTENIKLTTPLDLAIAEHIASGNNKQRIRIGNGYDVHRLVLNRPLVLCGVTVPFDRGLLGHSDADVPTHALMDSLLGALALGDIGKLFPDNDPQYEGANSIQLLKNVMQLVFQNSYRISNIDLTIIAEAPKLQPYIPKMRENIAAACDTKIENVSVKATTEEGLGIGQDGIAATAAVLLQS